MVAKEEYAVVLDFLPNGYPLDSANSKKSMPIIQAVGVTNFTVLELVPKKDVHLKSGDQVYIGDGKRDHIHHINGRIPISKLTNTAKGELAIIIKMLIEINEEQFVEFFNKSQPLSMRMHQLELLPGLGKKHMWEIIEERREPFKNFADIKARVKLLPNPQDIIYKRILKELDGTEKHKLFVKE
jgi:putative nucleotide binding protein